VDPATLVAISALLVVGNTLTAAVGFGSGLLVMPGLLLLGLPAERAIPLLGVCSWFQMLVSLAVARPRLPWRRMAGLTLLAVAFIPVGVWLLGLLSAFEPMVVRRVIGGLVLASLAAYAWLRPTPRARVHAAWTALVFPLAGVLSGLAGLPGPPLVLWTMAHSWDSDRTRATLWTVFLGTGPASLIVLGLRFGPPVWEAAGLGLAFAPVGLLGVPPGTWLGRRLPKPVLRRVAFVLLVLVAVAALQPW